MGDAYKARLIGEMAQTLYDLYLVSGDPKFLELVPPALEKCAELQTKAAEQKAMVAAKTLAEQKEEMRRWSLEQEMLALGPPQRRR